jgi:BirA family biotin operon repressor/biotin-[acetyl-CoA-carboxylase] ligase
MLGTFLKHLHAVLTEFAAGGFATLRKEWEALHVYAGKSVVLKRPDGSSELGIAAGIGEDGTLLLQTQTGLRRFHSGEVSLRPLHTPSTRSASDR